MVASGIHRNLCAMPERQPIASDLDAPRIVDRHMGVRCCQPHIPPQGKARDARTPDVAQAARWSPNTSSAQRQKQWLGPSGSGRRSRRRTRMRKSELGTAKSSRVGRTVNTRAAWDPACDSSSARNAGESSGRRARHKAGLPARKKLPGSSSRSVGAAWSSKASPQPGASGPCCVQR